MEKPEASVYEQSYSKDPKKILITLAMRLQKNVLKEKERLFNSEDEFPCLDLKIPTHAFIRRGPSPLKQEVS
jgi:hypothetical protein